NRKTLGPGYRVMGQSVKSLAPLQPLYPQPQIQQQTQIQVKAKDSVTNIPTTITQTPQKYPAPLAPTRSAQRQPVINQTQPQAQSTSFFSFLTPSQTKKLSEQDQLEDSQYRKGSPSQSQSYDPKRTASKDRGQTPPRKLSNSVSGYDPKATQTRSNSPYKTKTLQTGDTVILEIDPQLARNQIQNKPLTPQELAKNIDDVCIIVSSLLQQNRLSLGIAINKSNIVEAILQKALTVSPSGKDKSQRQMKDVKHIHSQCLYYFTHKADPKMKLKLEEEKNIIPVAVNLLRHPDTNVVTDAIIALNQIIGGGLSRVKHGELHPDRELFERENYLDEIWNVFQQKQTEDTKNYAALCIGRLHQALPLPEQYNEILKFLRLLCHSADQYEARAALQTFCGLAEIQENHENFVTRDFLSELVLFFKAKRTFTYVNTLWLLITLLRKGTLKTKQLVKDHVNSQIEHIRLLKDEANLKSMK
ncbi:MAG: hypothetical protein EZS28_035990, partial [Streblomastix strix]